MNNMNTDVTWRDYLELCKPKVVLLMLITAVVGMLLASEHGVDWKVLIFGTIGIAFAASSAAIVNHFADQRIDAVMNRTKNRPLPRKRIEAKYALGFAFTLAILSMIILCVFTNVLTAVLSLVALLGYAVFYTLYLKHATPQNIVIGGIAGAAPPLLGWTAVTGRADPEAWLLVLIIFTWTPPHFWALAIHRAQEYAKVNVPMLPVTHGIPFTKLCITLYTVLLIAVSLLPVVIGMSGLIYLLSALILGGIFLGYAIALQRSDNKLLAMKTFQVSIWYLLFLFCGILIDHYIPIWITPM